MNSKPPPPLREPARAPITPEMEAAAAKQQQLRMSYGMVFGSDHGKVVLADLKARYGWDGEIERPSVRFGTSHADAALTEGMKEPVRHILAMTTIPEEKPQQKPATATTA